MMQFNPIPTEQTTAATDVILALAALLGALYLWRFRSVDSWKATLWSAVMAGLALGAGLGAVVHGFVLADATAALLWDLIYLTLGIVVALFAVAALYDLGGRTAAARSLPVMLVVALVFFGLTKVVDAGFLVFIIYEGLVMTAALVVYLYLAFAKARPGAVWMALGVALTIVGAAVQALELGAFHFIWQFDHNSAYHLIQLFGLGVIIWALRTGFRHASEIQ